MALVWLFGMMSACERSDFSSVDWHLDVYSTMADELSEVRVCSNRIPNRDFLVVDRHFVVVGLPDDGRVQLTLEFMDDSGDWVGTTGPLNLEESYQTMDVRLCDDQCESACSGSGQSSTPGESSLAVRLMTSN